MNPTITSACHQFYYLCNVNVTECSTYDTLPLHLYPMYHLSLKQRLPAATPNYMLLQTAIPTLVRELRCLSVDLSVCPSVPTAGKQKWRVGWRATSDQTHLSINWTTFPCSMQIRFIDWNTDWAVPVLHTRLIPSLHSSSLFIGHTSFTTTETKEKAVCVRCVPRHLILHMRHEVLTVVMISIVVSWVVTLCSLVGGYQRFRGTFRVHT
jgi:hypothetical protein